MATTRTCPFGSSPLTRELRPVDKSIALAEAREILGPSVRNLSTLARKILVGTEGTSEKESREIVQFCLKLVELNDAAQLAGLMKEEAEKGTQRGLTPTPPMAWNDAALRVVDKHKEETDPAICATVLRSIRSVPDMVLNINTDTADESFEFSFENRKGEINLSTDPGKPYQLFSVCPVSGLIQKWEKTYREALKLL